MVSRKEQLFADYQHARDMVRACGDRELARIWRKIRARKYQRFYRAMNKAR